ncbi:MAG: hypothetical protein ACLFNS_05570 [Desulfobacterales bacterium]
MDDPEAGFAEIEDVAVLELFCGEALLIVKGIDQDIPPGTRFRTIDNTVGFQKLINRVKAGGVMPDERIVCPGFDRLKLASNG